MTKELKHTRFSAREILVISQPRSHTNSDPRDLYLRVNTQKIHMHFINSQYLRRMMELLPIRNAPCHDDLS